MSPELSDDSSPTRAWSGTLRFIPQLTSTHDDDRSHRRNFSPSCMGRKSKVALITVCFRCILGAPAVRVKLNPDQLTDDIRDDTGVMLGTVSA